MTDVRRGIPSRVVDRQVAYAADPAGAVRRAPKARADRRVSLRTAPADTAVERLTGQSPADGTPVEVNLTIGVEHLLDPDDPTPADLPGWGPVPAGLADDIIRGGTRVAWRWLFTAPTGTKGGRIIVGGDPKARRFTGACANGTTRFARCPVGPLKPFSSAPAVTPA